MKTYHAHSDATVVRWLPARVCPTQKRLTLDCRAGCGPESMNLDIFVAKSCHDETIGSIDEEGQF